MNLRLSTDRGGFSIENMTLVYIVGTVCLCVCVLGGLNLCLQAPLPPPLLKEFTFHPIFSHIPIPWVGWSSRTVWVAWTLSAAARRPTAARYRPGWASWWHCNRDPGTCWSGSGHRSFLPLLRRKPAQRGAQRKARTRAVTLCFQVTPSFRATVCSPRHNPLIKDLKPLYVVVVRIKFNTCSPCVPLDTPLQFNGNIKKWK